MMRSIKLIPFACSAGGQVAGSERAALDIFEADIAGQLQTEGLPVSWQTDPATLYDMPMARAAHADVPPLGSVARRDIVLWHCRKIQADVSAALESGALPVTLGGDHAMALGSVSALARAKGAAGRTGLLWIDAHADLNTPQTSPSQALHGMPVAALLGMGDPDYVALAGDTPVLSPEHIVYVGLRDVDPGEQEAIARLGITVFTMADIERLGIAEVFRRARAVIAKGTAAQAISIDLDAFDPEAVPAVGSPVPGGIDTAAALQALRHLEGGAGFDLIEIAEYNPALAGREKTLHFIRDLLGALLPVSEFAAAV